MPTAKTLRHLFGVLALAGGLFLAACGDSTTAPVSTPTTAATSVASTTTAATTAVTTSAVSTTVAPTTTVASSTSTAAPKTAAATPGGTTSAAAAPGVTTTPGTAGSGQPASGKAAELLANIPNTPGYLQNISFDNYVAFRKLNNIPADATFQSLSQDKDAFARFNNGSRILNPADIFRIEYLNELREKAGFDLFQADYDAQAGIVPNIISLAQGNFDTTAIDKAWTAGGATKGAVGSNTSYTFDMLDLTQPLQQIYLGQLSLITVPAQKLLILGKPPTAAAAVAGELPSKNPLTNNPAVKGLLDTFGDPISFYMGTSLISPNLPDIINISPNATAIANVKATFQATESVPPPLMGGYAFYQDAAGAKTYLVANYYTDPASARAAQPILEARLKTGTSLRSKLPYNRYWDVVSSEVKGNILVFKLNWKQLNGLNQFVFVRDFPAFLV